MPQLNKTILKLIACVLLIAVAMTSVFVIAPYAKNPETYEKTIASLSEKESTVLTLTVSTTAASMALSAIPGDATDPLVDQLTKITSYLAAITMIILGEKFLLTTAGLLSFTYLIPIGCLLLLLSLFLPAAVLRRFGAKLIVFALVFCTLIPFSIQISNAVESTQQYEQTITAASDAAEELEVNEPEKKGLLSSLTETLEAVKDAAANFIRDLLDAVALLIFLDCVIPVLTLLALIYITKALFSFKFDAPLKKSTAVLNHAAARATAAPRKLKEPSQRE